MVLIFYVIFFNIRGYIILNLTSSLHNRFLINITDIDNTTIVGFTGITVFKEVIFFCWGNEIY